MFIMVNDEITVENLLKGIIIVSGNDACVALAEGIAGSEEAYASLMTSKALEIGRKLAELRDKADVSNGLSLNPNRLAAF
mgnify:CR=1 FL=1